MLTARPAYAGALLSLLGARLGGLEWTVAGFLSTIVLAFVLHWLAETRQSATIAIASTVLGAGWIGLCLAHLLLLRSIPADGRLATFTVLIAVWAGDIGAFFADPHVGAERRRLVDDGRRMDLSHRRSPCLRRAAPSTPRAPARARARGAGTRQRRTAARAELPARAVLGALQECAKVGVKNAVIISSGFAEEGGDSTAMQDAIAKVPGVVDVLNGIENTISGPATTFQINPSVAARAGAPAPSLRGSARRRLRPR